MSVQQLNVKAAMVFFGRRIARLEVRTVSRQLLTGLCSTACFQKSNERSTDGSKSQMQASSKRRKRQSV
nr:MAG TPA: hypothetical protein [Caudoviricetes sp.]